MESVPKIVVKRLRSPAADSHPDADLLTAFAEQSLAGHERDQVVEHLAHCGDCREVVSLALPPQLEPLPLAHPSGSWFQWPVMRWATVAAGVALIASLGTLQYRSRRLTEQALSIPQAKEAIATNLQPASQATAPQTGMLHEKEKEKEKEKTTAAKAETELGRKRAALPDNANMHRPETIGGAIGGSVVRAPSAAAAKQNPVPATAQQTVTVEASGASQVIAVQSETAQVATETAAQNEVHGQLIQNETADQQLTYDNRVDKAKPASAQAIPAMAAPALRSGPGLLKSPASLRWTISATGALQRSLDGGKTWLDVNIAADNSVLDRRAITQMMTVEVQADSTSVAPSAARAASSADAKSMKKVSTPPAPIIFRAVSVSSNTAEVWAGGSGGALYHTIDGGNSWARVIPSTAGAVLTGDILSIQFSDAQNGTVTTSTAELWTTPNAGQTWRKQP
jgi:Photosynthesis system II assembly factor YCF48/Putative zinc-finger